MARDGAGAGWRGDPERLGHRARRRVRPPCVAGLIGPGDRGILQPMAGRLGRGAHDRLRHVVPAGNRDAAPLPEGPARQADALPGGDDAVPAADDAALPGKGRAPSPVMRFSARRPGLGKAAPTAARQRRAR